VNGGNVNGIPADIYETVLELALAIVNASGAGDEALSASLSLQLYAYYEEQSRLGRAHPFLTEAAADFSDDPKVAVDLYLLSLEQAESAPGEPKHTKMISLADRLLRLGRTEEAEAFLLDGLAEAHRVGDADCVEEALQLEKELKA
jgi:tetratricopeptide (TPR) repeat protein